jgi:cytochrome c6
MGKKKMSTPICGLQLARSRLSQQRTALTMHARPTSTPCARKASLQACAHQARTAVAAPPRSAATSSAAALAAAFLLLTSSPAALAADSPAAAVPPAEPAALFARNCAGCHAGGGNVIAPGATLLAPDLAAAGLDTPGAVFKLVYGGKGRMPGYGVDCAPKV